MMLRITPILASIVVLAACASGSNDAARFPTTGLDPTPLAKCRVGSGAKNPLVTEWPASEKARLESLLHSQPVFVRFTGCELELVDQCRVDGGYEWIRTTLSSDTVDIRSEDELYAKLPVGAAKLEGELRTSGRLQVRTRVAGQLRLTETDVSEPSRSSACEAATHLVSAVSLGAFKLTRGSRDAAGGALDAYGMGVDGRSTRGADVVNEAGVDAACEEATAEAAHPNCASPLQLFLTPLETQSARPPPDAVYISFPQRGDEAWTLHDSGNQTICATPCEAWVRPNSGFTLRRGSRSVTLPPELAFKSGEHAVASYRPRRGNPTAAKWMFWTGGVWMLAPGIALTTIGISRATADPVDCTNSSDPFCDEDENEHAGFFIGGGAVFLAAFGSSLFYYVYSEEEEFTLRNADAQPTGSFGEGMSVGFGPGFVRGTF